MADIGDKLKEYFDNKGITQSEIAERLGVSKAYVNALFTGKRAFGKKQAEAWVNLFGLSASWLLTGEGEMLANENTNSQSLPKTSYTTGRPYYNVDFIGGFDLIINDQTIIPEYNIDFAPYNQDGVFWCNITGHSMEPKVSHGDIIAIKEVSDWQSYLTMGEIYAIVTTNELRTVKIIRKGTSEDVFRLIPINTADFDEQEISKSMIMRVFEVLGCMKRI